ncbi:MULTISPECIES: RNA-binding protein [Spirulina sp. CCY15215]|jgi:RNA recognition motif-containing protein|uniref:RNA recognition motif domain-containing protein n=1 Tax=Spirulina sp. CCY15215 TaxID=2767591 RepID=UPI001950916C|nr:RNA-binding protein [Spirulina major]
MTVYIGNLSHDATEEDVNGVFAEYGSVKRVKIPLDRETGQRRGFGFVDMEEEKGETAAIENLDGAEWMGRTLKVNKAKPREDRPSNRNFSSGRDRY